MNFSILNCSVIKEVIKNRIAAETRIPQFKVLKRHCKMANSEILITTMKIEERNAKRYDLFERRGAAI